jgi:hypothetical protein
MDTSTNQINTSKRSSAKKTYILLGVALGTLSLAGFGYWYFKGRKGAVIANMDTDLFHNLSDESVTKPSTHTKPTTSKTPLTNISFPLKLHSTGELVKQVQNELIKKYGASLLPKYGADGKFGKELETALSSNGFSTTIDLTEFNKIITLNTPLPSAPSTQPTTPALASNLPPAVIDKIDIAKNLWQFATTKNLTKVIEQLKRIDDKEEYKGVNDLFKTIRLRGIRQTIVNGLLNSFQDDTAKQLIRQEFTRIGLTYDGDKWVLSGIYNHQVFATKTNAHLNSFEEL